MTLHLGMYYVSSHASARYFLIIHGDVMVHFDWPTSDSTDSQDLPQGGLGLPRL